MRNFAAIDFETANGKRTSVCSVGVVIVKDGKIVNKIYRLIRPAPNYYTQWTTAIHGLTYDDTMEAEDFPDVWAEIKPLIDGLPLVAHNSPFDEGCLRAVHELYDMTYPNYKFYCTCRTSRKVFGKAVTITTFTSDTLEPTDISVPATRIVAVTPIATQIAPALIEMKDRKKDTLSPPVITPLIPRNITNNNNAGNAFHDISFFTLFI